MTTEEKRQEFKNDDGDAITHQLLPPPSENEATQQVVPNNAAASRRTFVACFSTDNLCLESSPPCPTNLKSAVNPNNVVPKLSNSSSVTVFENH